MADIFKMVPKSYLTQILAQKPSFEKRPQVTLDDQLTESTRETMRTMKQSRKATNAIAYANATRAYIKGTQTKMNKPMKVEVTNAPGRNARAWIDYNQDDEDDEDEYTFVKPEDELKKQLNAKLSKFTPTGLSTAKYVPSGMKTPPKAYQRSTYVQKSHLDPIAKGIEKLTEKRSLRVNPKKANEFVREQAVTALMNHIVNNPHMYSDIVRSDGFLWNENKTDVASKKSHFRTATRYIVGKETGYYVGLDPVRGWKTLKDIIDDDEKATRIIDAAKQIIQGTVVKKMTGKGQVGKGRRKKNASPVKPKEKPVKHRTKQQAMKLERKKRPPEEVYVEGPKKRGRLREKVVAKPDFRPATWILPER